MTDDPSYGLCQCGCGQPTTISNKTSEQYGWVKGEPRPFKRGHSGRHRRFVVPWSEALWHTEDRGYGSDCWIWDGSRDKLGYGRYLSCTRIQPSQLAHRESYTRYVGPIPPNTELDHLCRQPACMNPAHLEPVSHRTNIRRGRTAKLSYEVADEIRALRETGEWTIRGLAAHYHVCTRTILDIVHDKRWARHQLPDSERPGIGFGN